MCAGRGAARQLSLKFDYDVGGVINKAHGEINKVAAGPELEALIARARIKVTEQFVLHCASRLSERLHQHLCHHAHARNVERAFGRHQMACVRGQWQVDGDLHQISQWRSSNKRAR